MKNVEENILLERALGLSMEILEIALTFPEGDVGGLGKRMKRSAYTILRTLQKDNSDNEEEKSANEKQILGNLLIIQEILKISLGLRYIDNKDHQDLNQKVEEVIELVSHRVDDPPQNFHQFALCL